MHKLKTGFLLIIVGIALSTMTLLVGCSDSEEQPREAENAAAEQEEAASREAQEQREAAEEKEPLDVRILVSASIGSDRRLQVEGESNLPDGAQVQVIVERELSRVRWRERVDIQQGQFVAGPFGPGSGLPDGGYSVSVELSEATVQPESVQQRIGEKGEYLAGELVTQSRHGLGQIAVYTTRFMVGNEPRQSRGNAELLQTP
ncbi:hypothetical protein [Halomonas sp. HL-93]|uniref:hypothetical protein n=1 Tax=Halomonas sp. HL-93 TaxID=1666906 RepID=UPI0006DABC81|nr:hypothetical protein [Halomonas sp. HL-93]KPQ24014.1 MAG: hypothetical protein HLUCCO06_11990 [Halomonas sp. HL-93]SBR47407.1 hypothetical protein GA0071314_1191 [Halomonas sp. HL-93]